MLYLGGLLLLLQWVDWQLGLEKFRLVARLRMEW